MVPVSLRLKNFMSYGESAPVLEFDQFHVACLSGANGQGKSALLDAITWALWGRARKSPSQASAAQDLLRIGQNDMHVEYVFDVEGARYRVLRAFDTNRRGAATTLELHSMAPGEKRFQPLSGSRISDTQGVITGIVGLEYDTFINSAFLLQGRSDEFTSRPAGERKEILARILNLGRYDILRGLAQQRGKEAANQREQAQAESKRLRTSLAEEPNWKRQLEELRGRVEEKAVDLGRVRKQEEDLLGHITRIRATGQLRDSLNRDIKAIKARILDDEKEQAQLQESISEADSLIARTDEIQSRYREKTALEKERSDLDQKAELYRGLERQCEEQRRKQTEAVHKLAQRLQQVKHQLEKDRKTLEDIEQLERERPQLEIQTKPAREAQRREAQMRALKNQADALDKEIDQLSLALAAEQQRLASQLFALEERVRSEMQAVQDEGDVKTQLDKLNVELLERRKLTAKVEEVRSRGSMANQRIDILRGRILGRQDELKRHEEQVVFLRQGASGLCPTCGTELTAKHRSKVDLDLRMAIQELKQSIKDEELEMEALELRRESLRTMFQELSKELENLETTAQDHAAVEERMRRVQAQHRQLSNWNAEINGIRKTLESEDFGADVRRRLAQSKAQRARITIDAAEYEEILQQAAKLDLFEERLAVINAATEKKDTLSGLMIQARQKERRLQQQLDSGKAVQVFRAKIDALERRMHMLDYDGARLHQVKLSLEKLSGASQDMLKLNNALQHREAWRRKLANNDSRIAKSRNELDAKNARERELTEELSELATLEAALSVEQEMRSELEKEIGELQLSLGQMDEKLQQAAKDRRRLKRVRAAQQEAGRNETLYKHLVAAFGKHGIPSLIIEGTRPEVEQRANDLLNRLTDGKMRIRIDTLRSKKSGGTLETLDIRIIDEMGEYRAYETYSGGEAFRVNFALRIALAQLLAVRAGVRVQTLVIDEGFGTQDEQGVQYLVEAINAIRDDFEKILIISHLPEIKDAFPVRIEVVKHPVTGSHFDVIGV